ncbi:hypothetical protein GCK72_021528 [Caenorhabditis remanei]|uniref:Uncharacterized protein n=1 Tax=Caenorhabditis remanei TaxID=31234 RepID=A0A6A5GKC6_CAERE|nr:hypothetical protein GCK72_021528 [Caenorhabditis remanei]KAF1754962.1 hypothetical protein GCK72_021528 [Caenorhabditis remanei]
MAPKKTYEFINEYCEICKKQLRRNQTSLHKITREKLCRGCYKKHKLPYGPSCCNPSCENRIGGKRKILVCVELPDDICQSCGYHDAMEKLKLTEKKETPTETPHSFFKQFMESQDLSGSIIQKFIESQNLTPPTSEISSKKENRESKMPQNISPIARTTRSPELCRDADVNHYRSTAPGAIILPPSFLPSHDTSGYERTDDSNPPTVASAQPVTTVSLSTIILEAVPRVVISETVLISKPNMETVGSSNPIPMRVPIIRIPEPSEDFFSFSARSDTAFSDLTQDSHSGFSSFYTSLYDTRGLSTPRLVETPTAPPNPCVDSPVPFSLLESPTELIGSPAALNPSVDSSLLVPWIDPPVPPVVCYRNLHRESVEAVPQQLPYPLIPGYPAYPPSFLRPMSPIMKHPLFGYSPETNSQQVFYCPPSQIPFPEKEDPDIEVVYENIHCYNPSSPQKTPKSSFLTRRQESQNKSVQNSSQKTANKCREVISMRRKINLKRWAEKQETNCSNTFCNLPLPPGKHATHPVTKKKICVACDAYYKITGGAGDTVGAKIKARRSEFFVTSNTLSEEKNQNRTNANTVTSANIPIYDVSDSD